MDNDELKKGFSDRLKGLKLKDLDGVECEQCGNPTFVQVHLLRKISAVLSPNGKGGFLPVPIFQCAACGHINEELMPRTENE
jgi:uncharacterized Zn finger protein|tara:strand:+ start:4098 stop:4343 length:246 start_codon:yes stop_codon:yes gene_type:complete